MNFNGVLTQYSSSICADDVRDRSSYDVNNTSAISNNLDANGMLIGTSALCTIFDTELPPPTIRRRAAEFTNFKPARSQSRLETKQMSAPGSTNVRTRTLVSLVQMSTNNVISKALPDSFSSGDRCSMFDEHALIQ